LRTLNEREIGLTPTLRIWTCHLAARLRIVAMGKPLAVTEL